MRRIGELIFITICPVLQSTVLLGAQLFGETKVVFADYLIGCFIPFYAWYIVLTG